jgi:dihydroorotate dehydrogenase (NAD+) catalytic subunit
VSGIDLAPHHKTGLVLRNPVLTAAGCFGLGRAYHDLVDCAALGAIVVGPVTARPNGGLAPPRAIRVPGGVLIRTGSANPGIHAVVREFAPVWQRLAVPTIVHVAGTRPSEVEFSCQRLAPVESVCGIELGLPSDATVDAVSDLVQSAARAAHQPLLVRLPLESAHLLYRTAIEAGAHALTVAAPPVGTVWDARTEGFFTGVLYGHLVLPLAQRALHRVAQNASVPLVGCGGVHTSEDARAYLRAGAVAVQVGSALWRDPAGLERIARDLDTSDPTP